MLFRGLGLLFDFGVVSWCWLAALGCCLVALSCCLVALGCCFVLMGRLGVGVLFGSAVVLFGIAGLLFSGVWRRWGDVSRLGVVIWLWCDVVSWC